MSLRVLIVGAGAIGGWLAACLCRGGAGPAMLARGATLEALRAGGLALVEGAERTRFDLEASDDAGALGRFDVALFAVKATGFAQAVLDARPALAHAPLVVTAMNGLPWWFLEGLAGAPKTPLASLDPGAVQRDSLARCARAAMVVHASTRVEAPGVVRVAKVDELVIGEPGGARDPRLAALAQTLRAGGVPVRAADDVRSEIWAKLAGNMSMNPVSALTRLSAGPMLADAGLVALLTDMMGEFERIGARIGLSAGMSPQDRITVARRLGDFRTSMLVDALAGRALEIDALLGCVVELARELEEPAPTSAAVLALAKGLDRSFAR